MATPGVSCGSMAFEQPKLNRRLPDAHRGAKFDPVFAELR